jgi:glycosyltransferase involved in cell wall biosynthesis
MITELYYEEMLNYKSYSTEKKKSIDNSDHIICISENTKKDLMKIFNVNEKKISVVYLGTNLTEKGNIELCKDKNFILYVGSRRNYKNFKTLIKAYSISKKIKKDLKLIFFGGERYSSTDANLIESHNLEKKNIKFISGDNSLLQSYYMNASLFIYPSLYEGFGLPILEAMINSCPVACSNTSSLPEIAGNAAEYFNPKNPEDICEKMEKIIYDNNLSKELISKGLIQSKKFSWKKCAEETLDVYKKIYNFNNNLNL